ncbi:hypothetical protein GCM10023171_08940 [Microbacterium panaciterrae]|uniref:Uncharacterized protein n=1 Tax=Microbacterium panaciterrae TaxID=985759 RepID=A0ABP8P663_9MICO
MARVYERIGPSLARPEMGGLTLASLNRLRKQTIQGVCSAADHNAESLPDGGGERSGHGRDQ